MTTPNQRGPPAEQPPLSVLGPLIDEIEEARLVLASLQGQINSAENELDSSIGPQLVEVNENLVRALLQAHGDAELAAHSLSYLSRVVDLDVLTGLPTRLLFLDRFAQAISNAKRDGMCLGVLFLDLDNFKEVNETLGHAVGDEILKQVARRFISAVREVDTVSRHGGDEFLILLDRISDPQDAISVAVKIISAMELPIIVGDYTLPVTPSIGISVYPDDGETCEGLIQLADAAMYLAKRSASCKYAYQREESLASDIGAKTRTGEYRSRTQHKTSLAECEEQRGKLQQANEQLVLAAISTQELQYAAQQAQRRQMEFIAVLAHELRTPLTPIRVAAHMMGQIHPENQLEMQQIIEQQLGNIARLAADLMNVSRSDTGKLNLEYATVDIAAVIDQAIDSCWPLVEARLQMLSVQLRPDVLEVEGDAARLEQVMRNLLDNASKYSPKGGRITLTAIAGEETIVITVSDNGIGITADAIADIFKPFAQEAHAVIYDPNGLGLGLTVVHQLIEAHGGSVVATSAGSGLGSQFVVTLPMKRPPPNFQ